MIFLILLYSFRSLGGFFEPSTFISALLLSLHLHLHLSYLYTTSIMSCTVPIPRHLVVDGLTILDS